MQITRKSLLSGKTHTMEINLTPEQYEDGEYRRRHGTLIQDAYPQLTDNEREFLKTGSTPEEWDELL